MAGDSRSADGAAAGVRQAAVMPRLGWLLLAALALFWGVNWPIVKVGVSEVPVFTFRAIAALVGGCGLVLLARAGRLPLRVPRAQWRGLVVASLLNIFAWNALMLYGVSLMESGRAAILAYTMPLWATLLGTAVLGDRLTPRQWLGLALGLVAMTVLLVGDARAIGAAPVGALVTIGAAIVWAAGTVALKYFRFTAPTTVMAAWQQLIGGVPLALCALAFELDDLQPVSFWPAFAVAYNAIVTSILCYWAWFKLVGMAPVVVSTVGTLLVPIVGVASGAWFLGEQPGADAFIALALVIAAIVAVLMPRRRGSGGA